MKPKENKPVRLYDYPIGHVNAYAVVRKVYEDGAVWLTNGNMPYLGTINMVYDKEEFERMTKIPD
jgi:hypothetical protein